MIIIEMVAQNGFPTKNKPVILTSEENKMYLCPLENEITSLETYEDLDDCKKKSQIANLLWSAAMVFIQAKTFGGFSQGHIAFVAYDEHADFPIWIFIVDNVKYARMLHYRCFDATDLKRRDKFAWALRRKEN